jgi:hypothetical protein
MAQSGPAKIAVPALAKAFANSTRSTGWNLPNEKLL